MEIGFLLCSPDISGGTNVIFEHAVGLKRLGHDVSIITQEKIDSARVSWHPLAVKLDWDDFDAASKKSYDVMIATWWESPYFLHLFQASSYVYFVQSIETRFFEPDNQEHLDLRDHSVGADRCNNGYFFNIPIITEATWIKQYLEEHFNQEPFLVPNGIRKELYEDIEPAEPRPVDRFRVLVEGPVDVFHKNVPRTIELCREAGVDEVWLLTSSDITEFTGVDRVFSKVPISDTPGIYSSCNLLVKLSYVEGMFGPPLEMFHSGGTALVYDVTGHDEYIVHGKNGLVVARDDEEQVVSLLQTLKSDSNLLLRLCEGASETASEWPGWQRSVQLYEKALVAIAEQPTVSRKYLENLSRVFMNYQTLQLESRELSRFVERESSDTYQPNNFVQLYVYQDGQLVDSSWKRFTCDKQTKLTIPVKGVPKTFQLRLDPGIRIGVVELYSVRLIRTGSVIAEFTPDNGFEKLYVTGTAKWLKQHSTHWVIESFGNDPQIFFPEFSLETEGGLTLEVELREIGYSRYVDSLDNDQAESQHALAAKLGNNFICRFLSKIISR